MEGYCIICGKKRLGIGIANDHVIEFIKWFKRNITKNEKGNTLVVCRTCYPEYKKRMDKYVGRRLIYVGIGVAFAVLGLLLNPKISVVLVSIFVIFVMYLVSLVNYTPGLNKLQKRPEHK